MFSKLLVKCLVVSKFSKMFELSSICICVFEVSAFQNTNSMFVCGEILRVRPNLMTLSKVSEQYGPGAGFYRHGVFPQTPFFNVSIIVYIMG